MTDPKKKELSRAFKNLRAEVTRLINEADPIGLLEIGAPTGEYDPEVGTILPRLKQANSAEDVANILHQEFEKWFGPQEAGPRRRYDDLAGRSGMSSTTSRRITRPPIFVKPPI